jgi:hypothetical protein
MGARDLTSALDLDDLAAGATGSSESLLAFGLDGLTSASSVAIGAVPGALVAHGIYLGAGSMFPGTQFNPPPRWLIDVAGRIERLSALPPGWDGHHANAIDRRALLAAWAFLGGIASYVRVPPTMVPTVSGGVALEWHRGGVDLELEFEGSGGVTASYEDGTGWEYEGPIDQYYSATIRAVTGLA